MLENISEIELYLSIAVNRLVALHTSNRISSLEAFRKEALHGCECRKYSKRLKRIPERHDHEDEERIMGLSTVCCNRNRKKGYTKQNMNEKRNSNRSRFEITHT